MTISVLNQGLAGMNTSQREIAKAADQIAKTSVPLEQPGAPAFPGGANLVGNANEPANLQKVSRETPPQDLIEPLIEMRRQEQIFTASAKMVSIADKTLGSLIDVTS